jgi:hypothetical protein
MGGAVSYSFHREGANGGALSNLEPIVYEHHSSRLPKELSINFIIHFLSPHLHSIPVHPKFSLFFSHSKVTE